MKLLGFIVVYCGVLAVTAKLAMFGSLIGSVYITSLIMSNL